VGQTSFIQWNKYVTDDGMDLLDALDIRYPLISFKAKNSKRLQTLKRSHNLNINVLKTRQNGKKHGTGHWLIEIQ